MDSVSKRNPLFGHGLIGSACKISFATASQMHFCSHLRVPWALDNHLWEQPSRWTTAKDIALYACSLHSVHNLCSLTKASFWNVYAPLQQCLFFVSNIKSQTLFAQCNQNIMQILKNYKKKLCQVRLFTLILLLQMRICHPFERISPDANLSFDCRKM